MKPFEISHQEISDMSPEAAYRYARNVIKERWKEGELAVAKDPYCAYGYARDIIKGRWLKAEPIIRKSVWWFDYKEDLKD